jgi:hypothetical protein
VPVLGPVLGPVLDPVLVPVLAQVLGLVITQVKFNPALAPVLGRALSPIISPILASFQASPPSPVLALTADLLSPYAGQSRGHSMKHIEAFICHRLID